jgi:hypothetical protein
MEVLALLKDILATVQQEFGMEPTVKPWSIDDPFLIPIHLRMVVPVPRFPVTFTVVVQLVGRAKIVQVTFHFALVNRV